jgi:hypothetical protein
MTFLGLLVLQKMKFMYKYRLCNFMQGVSAMFLLLLFLSIIFRVIICLSRPIFYETKTLHVINKSSDVLLMCFTL